MSHAKARLSLAERYPPSEPCACAVCRGFCVRPGWWSVEEAAHAINAGFAPRMMLEVSPEQTFGVLAPAFRGCEGGLALNEYAGQGCTFLLAERCELFGSGLQPLECRFCHHDRPGQGQRCHQALEQDWNSAGGQALVLNWIRLMRSARVAPLPSSPH